MHNDMTAKYAVMEINSSNLWNIESTIFSYIEKQIPNNCV